MNELRALLAKTFPVRNECGRIEHEWERQLGRVDLSGYRRTVRYKSPVPIQETSAEAFASVPRSRASRADVIRVHMNATQGDQQRSWPAGRPHPPRTSHAAGATRLAEPILN